MRGRVLVVAGSDSSGGAGIQADIKTVTALGGYAATAVTALTAQDTRGVWEVVEVAPEFVDLQMRMVLEDIGADCVKTGMLVTAKVVEAVAERLNASAQDLPLVLDPVMVAKGGRRLLDDGAIETLIRRLLPLAALVTPNLPEAERLTGSTIQDVDGMRRAAAALLRMGPGAVLLKGGHLQGHRLVDVLVWNGGESLFEGERIDTPHTHGTGCTLASGVATGLAQGLPLRPAIERARDYLAEAIRTAPALGSGRGPLNHAHTVR